MVPLAGVGDGPLYISTPAPDYPQEEGNAQDFLRMMERAGLRAQVRDVCHIFRRTWAVNAVKQRVPRQYTQAIAGWSTPQMLDHYTEAMQAEEGALEAFRNFSPFS